MDFANIWHELPRVGRELRRRGVARHDVDDVVQDVALGAWRSLQAGSYQAAPGVPPERALRAWLDGVAWRMVSNHRRRAYRRREVPVEDQPIAELAANKVVELRCQLDARDALRAVDALPEHYRDVLLAFGQGEEIADFARAHGMPEGAAWSRLRLGRIALIELLAGRGWRKP
jgi:DNA-directed RNA polymerase specialized sigma24 family protein